MHKNLKKIVNFTKLTYFLTYDLFFNKKQIMFTFLKFLMPIFGILISYFSYKYNSSFFNFKYIFPNLVIWIVYSRSFLYIPGSLIGRDNYRKNISLKILGFNKYDMIWSNFVSKTIAWTLPTAFFYFIAFSFAFNLNYSSIQYLEFTFLIFFSCFLFYIIGAATKSFQPNGENILLIFILYLLILLSSLPVIPLDIIDKNKVWFHWFALWNFLANSNLISSAIFSNKFDLYNFYLPIISSFISIIISFMLWKKIYWLKR